MTHALVPATEPIFEAYAVFADFDGNAPDSHDVVLLSSQELAEATAKLVKENCPWLCSVDGSNYSRRYDVRKTWAPARNIITSLEEAEAYLVEQAEGGYGEADEDDSDD